jgi:hypothetical protein
MNENATIVRAESGSARDRISFLHPSTNPMEHRRKGPFVIKRGEGIRDFYDKSKRHVECRAGLSTICGSTRGTVRGTPMVGSYRAKPAFRGTRGTSRKGHIPGS